MYANKTKVIEDSSKVKEIYKFLNKYPGKDNFSWLLIPKSSTLCVQFFSPNFPLKITSNPLLKTI